MEKFKNIDTISKRLETPIKNLHENLLEGHTGGNEVIDIIKNGISNKSVMLITCLLYTSPSPRDRTRSRMPSSA